MVGILNIIIHSKSHHFHSMASGRSSSVSGGNCPWLPRRIWKNVILVDHEYSIAILQDGILEDFKSHPPTLKIQNHPDLNISSLLRTNERHNHQKTWRSMSFAPPPNLPGPKIEVLTRTAVVFDVIDESVLPRKVQHTPISHTPAIPPKGFMNLDLLDAWKK